MEPLQHRGRSNRFLLCFRPLPMAGSLKPSNSQPASDDPVLAYIAVGDKDRREDVIPAILSSLPDDEHKSSDQELSPTHRKKRGFSRHLSRAVKAVLFETALVKRIRSKRSRQDSFRSTNSAKSNKFSNLILENLRSRDPSELHHAGCNEQKTKFSSHPSIRSVSVGHTSSASMCLDCPTSGPSKLSAAFLKNHSIPKDAVIQKSGSLRNMWASESRASYTGLCLLLVSLFALIFWGKLCAIFCASTWLFLVPNTKTGNRPMEKNGESLAVEYAKLKEEVVMGRLQGKSRRRNTHTASFWPTKF